jgi:signal transduction histidine kinase
MQPPSYHPALLKQLQETLGPAVEFAPSWQPLLQAVSASYAEADARLGALEAEVSRRTEQLIASTSNAYSFLDSIHKGFLMCDTSGEVVLTNNSLRRILAQKAPPSDDPAAAPQLTIETLNARFQPDIQLKQLVDSCLASREPQEYEAVNFGPLVLQLSVAPVLHEAGSADKQLLGAVVLFEDITEQKVLERAKDEFLSIASHELRTPLTAIRGNTALVKKYYAAGLKPEVNEMIEDIHQSSVRLIGIVNDFLDVAAMEQGKISMQPEPFPLQAVAAEVVRELEQLCADKGVTLAADDSVATVPPVYADKQRSKQVIINLVGNAIKFTDKGSITISARSDDRFVYTTVTDTGTGMSSENQKLLFRKFQQAGSSLLTRNTSKGTGLGLYISKLIVELSGGTISLERSQLDKGSAFTFSLPRQPAAST